MNGAEKLRLVSVCDKETGVCLFQRTWQWRGDQERSSIGNLVQSFYQFAREVDQGGEKPNVECDLQSFVSLHSRHRLPRSILISRTTAVCPELYDMYRLLLVFFSAPTRSSKPRVSEGRYAARTIHELICLAFLACPDLLTAKRLGLYSTEYKDRNLYFYRFSTVIRMYAVVQFPGSAQYT